MVPSHTDTSRIGVAMLDAVASGALRNLAEAARLVGGGTKTFQPDSRRAAVYDHAYAGYRHLFDTLEPMFP